MKIGTVVIEKISNNKMTIESLIPYDTKTKESSLDYCVWFEGARLRKKWFFENEIELIC